MVEGNPDSDDEWTPGEKALVAAGTVAAIVTVCKIV